MTGPQPKPGNPFELFAAIFTAVGSALVDVADGLCTALGLPTSAERRALDEHFRTYTDIDPFGFRGQPGMTLRTPPSPGPTKQPEDDPQ